MRKAFTSILTSFAIITAAVIGLAQKNDSERLPPNVEILSQKWSRIAVLQRPDRWDRVFDPSSTMPATRDARSSRGTRYAYEARIKNTGDKPIRAITWDYVFTDPKTRKEIDRRSFYNAVTIHPSKTKKIEGYTRSAPSSTVSATGEPSERVIVECVVLEDGSTWRQPFFSGSCNGNRR